MLKVVFFGGVAILMVARLSFAQAPSADLFPANIVVSESGFEGAVTVLDASVEAGIGMVTVEVPYRDLRGATRNGQARLFVRQEDWDGGQPLPLFCHVHYEKDPAGAAKWCARGWAVVTAHYVEPGYPIDASPANSYNQTCAIIQWARRLPRVDRIRLHLDGGSQGGYMALAMASEFFPVTSVTSESPVVNWSFNLNYFDVNRPFTGYPGTDWKQSPLPIMCAVSMLSDWCYQYFGNDLASDTWRLLSPIASLPWISAPVLLTCATGDMLVPHEQITRLFDRPFDPGLFPPGYQRGFDALTPNPASRQSLQQLLPPDACEVFPVSLQEGSWAYTLPIFLKETPEPPSPPVMDLPWSRERQWSIVLFDEGPPQPQAPHTSYKWATSPDSFTDAYQKAVPQPILLTAGKLDRLLQRYMGELDGLPLLNDGTPANRIGFALLEKIDVLSGLLDFASLGEVYATQLGTLYAASARKPFGEIIDLAAMAQERDQLRTLLVNPPVP